MKKKGKILTIIGLLLIAAALVITAYNLLMQARADRAAREALAQLQIGSGVPEYLLNPNMEMPTQTIDGREYIGKLDIPSQNLSLPILSTWSYPYLYVAPCRYQGSAYLSDFVICAHNYDFHFGKLKYLSIGDNITFTDVTGNVIPYRVTEVEILQPTAIEEMITGDWDMTLFTCTIGGRTRVTVRCDKVK